MPDSLLGDKTIEQDQLISLILQGREQLNPPNLAAWGRSQRRAAPVADLPIRRADALSAVRAKCEGGAFNVSDAFDGRRWLQLGLDRRPR